MGRKWNNSKGVGVDSDRAKKREIDKLSKELIKTTNNNKRWSGRGEK